MYTIYIAKPYPRPWMRWTPSEGFATLDEAQAAVWRYIAQITEDRVMWGWLVRACGISIVVPPKPGARYKFGLTTPKGERP